MTNSLKETSKSTQRLHIDRKMVGILSVFTVLGVCLVITILVATNTLSALRGYASLQTHWTEARKEVSMQVGNYFRTEDSQHFSLFKEAITEIEKAEKMRLELLKDHPDYEVIRSGFLAMHTIPSDIDIMISAFERFYEFQDFKDAMSHWIRSDQLVQQIKELAIKNQKEINQGTFDTQKKQEAISSLEELDRELTQVQYKLSEALSSGTHFLNDIILWVSISLGFILLGIGGFLSFRFSKSIKGWRRAIEISEQQYRSLFDQNPNAVYAISKEGHLLSGNKGLEQMLGYSIEEVKDQGFPKFILDSQVDEVLKHFQRALEGTPQTYEATGVRKDGSHIYAQITNLPIYVDGSIIGVYGIAQDITMRKKREQQIEEQLHEKTHLLSEVHDRVKNNLALISSLIQLQQDNIEGLKQEKVLGSTVSRIHSLALVHEQMYQAENFSRIRLDKYLQAFRGSLTTLSSEVETNSDLVLDANPVTLSIKQAIPSALILTELVTNAYKYAQNGSGKAEVKVDVVQNGGMVTLKVSDNGPGLSEKVSLEDPQTLGFTLINGLIKQLEATFELDRKDGTTVTIQFENSLKGEYQKN